MTYGEEDSSDYLLSRTRAVALGMRSGAHRDCRAVAEARRGCECRDGRERNAITLRVPFGTTGDCADPPAESG
ncbi:hypothetical protein BC936DRAFT_140740 [Jimgerdemannia flammicorona]|uniref:Uncharacterized protein n=1 Tax=Jimgerdemannia flammicorona TaxID=994334 RepID=A0A433AB47_9FUNG|nr:hypothetical protein BC936DRAFT_140740 [Jimgerdemannia flammicorona]